MELVLQNEDDTVIPTFRPTNMNRNYSLIRRNQQASPLQTVSSRSSSTRPGSSRGGSSPAVLGAEQTHTYAQSLLAQKAAENGEEQMPVKGTRQRAKRQKDNVVSAGEATSASLNFLYAKERGEE